MVLEYAKAKEKLLANMDKSCQHFFVKKGYILEQGYYKLLQDDLSSAKQIFEAIKDENIRASWALFMISMIEGKIKEYPSYFVLRNFLEIDLNILIHYYKGNYVENIIRYSDFMFNINPEVYKFVGRVLYNNGLEQPAMYFLEKAKNYFYNDPELHYLLAYIFYKGGEYLKAQRALTDCLEIIPEYFPAINLTRKIEQKIDKQKQS